MARRVWMALLALCVLLLSGCDDVPDLPDVLPEEEEGPVAEAPVEDLVFTLPFSHDDTLNPFSAVTEVNLQLSHLLYDRLTVLTDGYVPQPSLAVSVTATDATHLTATLREGAVFSDGSAVTVADVVKSFELAQASANYKTLLQNVASAKGDAKKRQVTFTLASADVNAPACLTFPVIKASTLTDEAAQAPVGGGIYTVQQTDGAYQLVKNPHHPAEVNYTEVGLRHLPNTAARYYALASGKLAYYFDDLSEGDLPRITGASQPVSMNAMVFMGVNSAHKQLSKPAVRRALSLLLDRTALSGAYGVYGTPSASPLPTEWQPVADGAVPAPAQDIDTAKALLEEAAYPLKDKELPALRLIYLADRNDRGVVAAQVRSQADACGIKIEPVPLEEKEYYKALKDGEYELYLGEYRFGADMSLRALLLGGKTSYGVASDDAAKAAYSRYVSGEGSLQEFLDAFGTSVPFLPLCYRGGVAAYDRRLTAVTPTGYDPYGGIAGWK